MSEWKSVELPAKYIGEVQESGNNYVTVYRTVVLLPSKGPYAGYCFLHPTKLVQETKWGAKIVYTVDFTFELVKHEREPGQRYKRYKLNAAELCEIYAEEIQKLKAREEKKEQKRLAQTGTILVAMYTLEYRPFKVDFLFQYKGKVYYGHGGDATPLNRACWVLSIEHDVTRGQFERIREQFENIEKEYTPLFAVHHALANSKKGNEQMKTAFLEFCQQWEQELCRRVSQQLEDNNK